MAGLCVLEGKSTSLSLRKRYQFQRVWMGNISERIKQKLSLWFCRRLSFR